MTVAVPALTPEYRRLLLQLPFVSTDVESTARALGTTASAKQILAALGKEEKPAVRKGVLSYLFDQQKGILTAPGRFVSAGLMDILGYQDEEGRLAEGNPLESAVRSAAGEFAITGGDIVKVNPDDSFVDRLGKYASALSYDIVTDPTSWFGNVAALSRKGAAIQAVNQGDRILASARNVAARFGKGDTLVDELFESSRIANLGKVQKELGGEIKPFTALDALKVSPKGVVSQEMKERVAGFELGRIIGESFLTGGRTRVRKQLANLLGSDEAAKMLFKELPQDIAGGLFLKQPFTGRPLAKIAGGQGGGGRAMEALSVGRFALSAVPPISTVSRHLAGKTGPTWAAVKKGLLVGSDLGDRQRTTLLDFVSFRKALGEKQRAVNTFNAKTVAVLSNVAATRSTYNEEGQKLFDQAVKSYYLSPAVGLPASANSLELEAHQAANEIRAVMNDAHAQLRAAGVEIRDLGPEWSPLIYTDEEAARIVREEYRGAGLGKNLDYNPTEGRDAYVQPFLDPDEAASLGYTVPGKPGLVFKNAAEVNKELGREVFETDPLKIATKYLNWASRSLGARRFLAVASSTGTLVRFPAETEKVLRSLEASAFMVGSKDVSAAAVKKQEAILTQLFKQVKELVNPDSLARIEKEMSIVRNESLADYTLQNERVRSARAEARAAAREQESALSAFESATRSQPQVYGRAGAEQMVAETQRLVSNARSRLSKARRSFDDATNDLLDLSTSPEAVAAAQREAAQLTGEPVSALGVAEQFAVDTTKAQQRVAERVDKVVREEELVSEAKMSLEDARAFREQQLSGVSGELMSAFQRYEQATARIVRATETLDNAVALRNQAKQVYEAARKDLDLWRVKGITAVADAYTESVEGFHETVRRIGVPLSKMSESQTVMYNTAKAKYELAEKLLFDTLRYATKSTKVPGAGAEYAKQVVELARKMSGAEAKAARLFADVDKLNTIIDGVYGMDRNTVMNAIGDMVATYKSVRNTISHKELKELGVTEAQVLRGTAGDLVKERPVISRAGRMLAQEGEMRQLGASEIGVNMAIPNTLRDVFAPEGIASVLEQMYRAEEFPSEWSRWLQNKFDPLMMVWKSTATTGRGPAYVLTNTVGGMFNNYLARVSTRSHAVSAKMIASSVKALRKIQKENPNRSFLDLLPLIEDSLRKTFQNVEVAGVNAVDLFVEFLERGGHFSTDTFFTQQQLAKYGLSSKEPLGRVRAMQYQDPTSAILAGSEQMSGVKKLANFVLSNPYQVIMNDAAQASELFVRFAAFTEGFARHGNFDDAMDLSMMLHFDYQDLSGAELWFRRLVPFYSWTRNNIPLQFRAMFLATDQVGRAFKTLENFKEAFALDEEDQWLNDYMPEYLQTAGGFVSRFTFGGNHLALFPKLPLNDLDSLLSVGYIGSVPVIMPRRSQLISMTGPAPKTVIEVLTNRNFEYGREYETLGDMIQGQARNLLPYYGTGKRVLSAAGLPIEKERQLSNLLQFLVGSPYGTTTYTEKTFRGAAMARNIELNKQVKQAAADAGVDLEWLREQVNDGVPLPALMARIAAGQGDVERVRIRKMLEGRKESRSDRDYADVLRGFQTGRVITGY